MLFNIAVLEMTILYKLTVLYNIRHDIPRLQLRIKSLGGQKFDIFVSDCQQDCEIRAFEEKIQTQEGFHIDQQRLIFNGKQLGVQLNQVCALRANV